VGVNLLNDKAKGLFLYARMVLETCQAAKTKVRYQLNSEAVIR